MTDRPCLQSEVSSAWQISLKQSRGRWSELESRCGGGASSSLSQIEKEEYCLRSPAHRPFLSILFNSQQGVYNFKPPRVRPVGRNVRPPIGWALAPWENAGGAEQPGAG